MLIKINLECKSNGKLPVIVVTANLELGAFYLLLSTCSVQLDIHNCDNVW